MSMLYTHSRIRDWRHNAHAFETSFQPNDDVCLYYRVSYFNAFHANICRTIGGYLLYTWELLLLSRTGNEFCYQREKYGHI